jgi:iron complex outermembrane recepter protein
MKMFRPEYAFFSLILLASWHSPGKLQAQSPAANDSLRVFTLGEVTISARVQVLTGAGLDSKELEERYTETLPVALQGLPGVSLSAGGSKNEPMLYLRGFSLRQVPVFVDGIPVYVPYDGIFDLSRIQSTGISKVTVEKGFSSMLYGANTMGGAINILSTKPLNKVEGSLQLGTVLSSQGLNKAQGGLYIGGRHKSWYMAANINLGKRNFVSLPGQFDTLALEQDQRRDNSGSDDFQTSVRIGYEPKPGHEYALTYTTIRAAKGVPVYLGSNPALKPRFWQYPRWDKDCIHLHSTTPLGARAILRTRWFYDSYFNELRSYDNNTYSSQTKGSSFTSFYDDYSLGSSVDLHVNIGPKHELKAGISSKYDHHSEYNLSQQARNFADVTTIIGMEDVWTPSKRLRVLLGAAFQFRSGLEAEDYSSAKDSVFSFPLSNSSKPNIQMRIEYKVSGTQDLWLSASSRSRFATMKDRYSYRFGTSLPNPDLVSEQALHFETGYAGEWKSLSWEFALFHSALSDVIQRVDEVEPGKYQFRNTGKAIHQGLEIGLAYRPVKAFSLNAAYTLLRLENLSQPGLLFVDIPNHFISSRLTYHYDGGNRIMAELQGSSMRNSSSDGNYQAAAFTLINLGWEHNFKHGISLQASIKNLLDKEYYYEEGYIEEGRTFTIVFSCKLGK